jgi:hypothetical protein
MQQGQRQRDVRFRNATLITLCCQRVVHARPTYRCRRMVLRGPLKCLTLQRHQLSYSGTRLISWWSKARKSGILPSLHRAVRSQPNL